MAAKKKASKKGGKKK